MKAMAPGRGKGPPVMRHGFWGKQQQKHISLSEQKQVGEQFQPLGTPSPPICHFTAVSSLVGCVF